MPASPLSAHSVAIVIPAFNEALRIRDVVTRALRYTPLIVVVDDCSEDGTPFCINDLPVTCIRHQQRLGKGAALRSGFHCAQHHLAARAVMTIDGDGQHDPDDFPSFLDSANRNPESIIIGARLFNRENQPIVRRIGNALGDWGISWACGHELIDSQSGHRLYPASLMPLATQLTDSQGFAYEADLLIQGIQKNQLGIVAVPIAARYAHPQMAGTYRKSHFRLVRDLLHIISHVSKHILRQGQLIVTYRRVRQHPIRIDTTPLRQHDSLPPCGPTPPNDDKSSNAYRI